MFSPQRWCWFWPIHRFRSFLKWGYPQNEWFLLGKIPSFEMDDDWGYPYDSGNLHLFPVFGDGFWCFVFSHRVNALDSLGIQQWIMRQGIALLGSTTTPSITSSRREARGQVSELPWDIHDYGPIHWGWWLFVWLLHMIFRFRFIFALCHMLQKKRPSDVWSFLSHQKSQISARFEVGDESGHMYFLSHFLMDWPVHKPEKLCSHPRIHGLTVMGSGCWEHL